MTTTPATPDPSRPLAGIVVIDKPSGWTSHQVVSRLRRLAGTRRVGHAGTLDPMATGVLVVGINQATRLLGHLSLTDKEYLATIRLGMSTVTDDADGDVLSAPGADRLTVALVEEQLAPLRGDILQTPSSVSAIKVAGVRSYARVRSGQEVTLRPRPVRVSRLEVLAHRRATVEQCPVVDLDVAVQCSSGTYVRALARDLGDALGVGGHLTALCRTRVGPFDLSLAQTLDDAALGLAVLPLAAVARLCFPTYVLDDEEAERVSHGRRLPAVRLASPTTAMLTRAGDFVALYRPDGEGAVAVSVFSADRGRSSSNTD